MLKARMGLLAVGALVAVGLFVTFESTALGDLDVTGVKQIAELVKKGDMAAAKKAAAAYAKKNTDVEDVMNAFKPAKKKGIGVTGTDQGIEQSLNKVGRDAPTAAAMDKMAAAYEEMGYNIAAVGLITEALAPEKDAGKKTRKAWLEWAAGTTDAGAKLAAAAKAKGGAELKVQAAKVNANCNSCHTTFR